MRFKNKKINWLLNQPIYLSLLVAFILGLWSLLLGQDRNWDLANYHLYNAFSFVNNKIDLDFAVAGAQTYLNPLLDIPYYFMTIHLKAPYLGFLMGFIHGFAFLLVLLIAKQYQDKLIQKKHVVLFAFAGIITPNYLSELGNTMGDNITSILNLFSVLLILAKIDKLKLGHIAWRYLFLPGLIIGLSVGLKLTNAPFAVACVFALFFLESNDYKLNLKNSIYFSIFVLVGIFISGGFWFLTMWHKFHNPIFPLYSNFFPNELIDSNIFNDDPFGPKNLWETILWPFVSSIHYLKFGRGLVHQIYWPIIYTLLIIIFAKKVKSFFIKSEIIFNHPKEKFLIIFTIISYVISVKIFSMQRYLITIELLAPIIVYICLKNITNKNLAWKNTKIIIFISILITLLGGFGTWGHSGWESNAFKAEIPKIIDPKKTTVIITDTSPVGWLVTLFNKDISFVRIGTFQNKNEKKIINSKIQKKPSKNYVLFSGYYNWRQDNVKKWNGIFSSLNLLSNEQVCQKVQNFISKSHFRGQIIMEKNNVKDACFIDLHPNDKLDENIQNESLISLASEKLNKSLDLNLNRHSCAIFKASIGSQNWRYIWCELH
jgi:hypothetical protein